MRNALWFTFLAFALIGCTSTEELESQDFSMRYEICRHGYAGPDECPEFALHGETAEEY